MELELKERIAVITGASAGIGRGIAKVLAEEGAQTIVIARRENLLASLRDEIERSGGKRPMAIAADLRDAGVPSKIRDQVLEVFGHLDILVNNVGSAGLRTTPTDDNEDDEIWAGSFAINLGPARRMTRAFLPMMQKRRWGRIINLTGSLEPSRAAPAHAAKAAISAWSKGLSREVGRYGITVNCVAPGKIHSEQIDTRVHPSIENQDEFAKANIPLGYFGDPEDMACLVAFLCSQKARYITGQRIHVDGGLNRSI